MCSMLVPSEFSHLRTRPAKNLHFCTFLGNCPHFREREKVAETLRQCTFSFDNLLFFCMIVVRVIAQEAPKTLKWLSGCAHLLVHIRRPPRNIRTYPRSGLRSGGTSAKTTLFGNNPFVNPRSAGPRGSQDSSLKSLAF